MSGAASAQLEEGLLAARKKAGLTLRSFIQREGAMNPISATSTTTSSKKS